VRAEPRRNQGQAAKGSQKRTFFDSIGQER
jgi:hypothetical protein